MIEHRIVAANGAGVHVARTGQGPPLLLLHGRPECWLTWPGNLAGGFSYCRAAHDPLFPFAWTDRLSETSADLDLALFPGVGHFPHREDPDRATAEIAGFVERLR